MSGSDTSFQRFEEATDERQQRARAVPVWGALMGYALLMLALFATSTALCGLHGRTPTLYNMLNDSLAAPFAVGGFAFGVRLHLVATSALYARTEHRSWLWARAQVGAAVGLYASLFATLFIFPVVGAWRNNWGGIPLLFFTFVWMATAQLALKRLYKHNFGYKRKLLKWSALCTFMFAVCAVTMIVLHTVPIALGTAEGREAGLLVTEIFSGIGFVGFVVCVMVHTWRLRIWIGIRADDP